MSSTTINETNRGNDVRKRHDEMPQDETLQPVPDFVDYVRDYARQKPKVAAMWCFGIGFVLGWRLKPW